MVCTVLTGSGSIPDRTWGVRKIRQCSSVWQSASLLSLWSWVRAPALAHKRRGAVEACWAHNPKVDRSKLSVAIFLVLNSNFFCLLSTRSLVRVQPQIYLGSSVGRARIYGTSINAELVQLVMTFALHAKGREFDSRILYFC